ncbi:PucR family transcriptional regulator ligand-binding domain-containing protein [Rhodococcus fascians]|jgi:DNA-binding PucR family transcriptional regulator|uniref:PucR family transcriptional regulator n=1 Tax=Nocardiaceae TaxID=85025 RepID=UPI00040AA315|nr:MULTISPECIES: PucR family transcriptional regulator [Rhodococcus]MDP9637113.1 DNA-binding PucR family transcriptional regulator [Rhodococcus cercidiphylli]RZL75773.1 MAG: PucR family transcriptional regulator [Rhodococcus sp. (in: high G+C Gram-positive bacteria)]MBY3794957.1 PucR family transcriptional regulator ligand-binding domain-containing protein [Rhodococcus fascians]MBY3827732.1 PucR family transcriptional regulator ligand-binding domain-containing protein [Rhodococcus fascians]MBY
MYVGDLLDASHLGIRLLTSDRDALGRTLRWTFTTDLPDPSRYIAGGELVITGLVWRRTPDDSEVFVRSVAESGATALAAGEGLLGHIPLDLVDACERHGLPLLAVPDTVSFGEVTEFLVGRVTGDRIASLNNSLVRQRQLLTAVADGRALDELALHISRETGMACLIYTATGRRLVTEASALSDADVDTLTHAALSSETLPTTTVLADGSTYSVFGVGPSLVQRTTRWFLAVAGDMDSFSPDVSEAFGQLAAIAALDRARREEGRLVRREIADQAVALIEHDSTGFEALTRLRQAGVDPDRPLVVVRVAHSGRVDLREMLRSVVGDTLTSFGGGCVGCSAHGDIVAVVNTDDTLFAQTIRIRLSRLRSGIGPSRIHVGVSAVATGLTIDGALRSARHALELSRQGSAAVTVTAGTKPTSAVSMMSALPDDVRKSFVEHVLAPLLEHDRRTDADLTDTLREFLANGGSWHRTAESMHVHLNTVRYRIKRVEELLGRDLGSTADRLDVYLALQSMPRASAHGAA